MGPSPHPHSTRAGRNFSKKCMPRWGSGRLAGCTPAAVGGLGTFRGPFRSGRSFGNCPVCGAYLGMRDLGDARAVLSDIYHLLFSGKPAAQRFGLKKEVADSGETYWSIRE